MYPFPKDDDKFMSIAFRKAQREAHVAAVTKEREAHKKEVHELLEAIARGEDLNAKIRWDDAPISDYQKLKNELEKERERAKVLEDAAKDVCEKLEPLLPESILSSIYKNLSKALKQYNH